MNAKQQNEEPEILETAGVSEIVEISKIIPYENNAKIHTKEQIEEIKKSIKTNGYYQQIVVDEDNIILAGHGRLEAIKELGYKKVGIKKLSGLSELEKRKLRLDDNFINSMTGYELHALSVELTEIKVLGGEVQFLGLNKETLTRLEEHTRLATLGKNKEIDIESLNIEGKIIFKFDETNYEKVIQKINIIRQENSFNSNEEVLLFLLEV